jgi:hypothetical protein
MRYKKFLSLILPFLLIIVYFSPHQSWSETISDYQIWRVHHGTKKPISDTTTAKWELEQVLTKVNYLAALTSYQLPSDYILIQFHHPVVLSTFSPIKYPFRSVIITIPKHQGQRAQLLIRNGQGSWVEYHTERPLKFFLQKIAPSSTDNGASKLQTIANNN